MVLSACWIGNLTAENVSLWPFFNSTLIFRLPIDESRGREGSSWSLAAWTSSVKAPPTPVAAGATDLGCRRLAWQLVRRSSAKRRWEPEKAGLPMGGSQGGARGGFCPKRSQEQKGRDQGGVAWALASVWVLEPLEDGTHCRA